MSFRPIKAGLAYEEKRGLRGGNVRRFTAAIYSGIYPTQKALKARNRGNTENPQSKRRKITMSDNTFLGIVN